MLDSEFASERHICSISSSAAQRIGLLSKSFRVFGGSECITEMF